MSPSGSVHGHIAFTLSLALGQYVRRSGAGFVFGAETGFVLERDPDTVRAPDCAFVRANRIPAGGIPEGFFPGPPDLAIEVLSPNDRLTESRRKAVEYLDAGAHAVWLVVPKSRVIEVHEPGSVRIYRGRQSVSAGLAAPGFRMRVDQAFAGLGRPSKA